MIPISVDSPQKLRVWARNNHPYRPGFDPLVRKEYRRLFYIFGMDKHKKGMAKYYQKNKTRIKLKQKKRYLERVGMIKRAQAPIIDNVFRLWMS
jgi:hypothetical protein